MRWATSRGIRAALLWDLRAALLRGLGFIFCRDGEFGTLMAARKTMDVTTPPPPPPPPPTPSHPETRFVLPDGNPCGS